MLQIINEDESLSKLHALQILNYLVSSEDTVLQIFTDSSLNLPSTLMKILRDTRSESRLSRLECLKLFLKISANPHHDKLIPMDLIDTLVVLLKEEKDDIRFHSLELLWSLTCHDESCLVFSDPKKDLIAPLIDVLGESNSDDKSVTFALLVIENLSYVQDSRQAISNPSLQLLDTLCLVINKFSCDIRRKALDIMCDLCKPEDISENQECSLSFFEILVKIIAHDSENQLKALEIICNFSATDTNRQTLCLPILGLLPIIVSIIKHDIGRARMEALLIISNLISLPENIPIISCPLLGLAIVLEDWKNQKLYIANIGSQYSKDPNIPPILLLRKILKVIKSGKIATYSTKTINTMTTSSYRSEEA